mgnify:CR=1 FL=1
MFENCTIKYRKFNNINSSIDIIHPEVDGVRKVINVPLSSANTDYKKIQEWVDEGNTIEAAD